VNRGGRHPLDRAQGWPRIALQLPASHAQRPPQSSVPGWQFIVHITPAQSGFALAGAQVLG
jgi:hypothetical protein